MKISIKIIWSVILIIAVFSSCKKESVNSDKIELPAAVGDHQIIEHFAYTLSYNEEHEQADWVAYELTKEEAAATTYERTDDFRVDPSVTGGSADLSDYQPTENTYARGHMAPAADFRWSEKAMSESFFMSNMSPQVHAFNEGKWMWLESEVRHWAEIYNGVYVVTGPVLKDGLPTIGTHKVSVPETYYKVILDLDEEKGIGFLMPNKDIEDSFKDYAVSIDDVEAATGLDFFPALDDKTEEKIESTLNMSLWDFKYYK
ncbi:MAG: DNA/RNA non-specific endonuclease [Chlorobi bacterium]|nr:DNA/RNA non-specific endonuclease [Chlorobiota bacterium]